MNLSNRFLRNTAILLGFFTLIGVFYDYIKNYDNNVLYYKRANEEFLKKNYEKSLKLYTKIYNENKKNVFAIDGQARSLMRLKLYNEAEEKFKEVLKIDENFVSTYANLGILYDTTGRHRKAIYFYDIAISKDSQLVKGMGWLNRLLKNIQFKPSSIKDRRDYLLKQYTLSPIKRRFKNSEMDNLQPDFQK